MTNHIVRDHRTGGLLCGIRAHSGRNQCSFELAVSTTQRSSRETFTDEGAGSNAQGICQHVELPARSDRGRRACRRAWRWLPCRMLVSARVASSDDLTSKRWVMHLAKQLGVTWVASGVGGTQVSEQRLETLLHEYCIRSHALQCSAYGRLRAAVVRCKDIRSSDNGWLFHHPA